MFGRNHILVVPGNHRKVPFFLGNWIAGFRGKVDGNSEMHSNGCFPGTFLKSCCMFGFNFFLFEEIHGFGVSVGYKTSQHISSDF